MADRAVALYRNLRLGNRRTPPRSLYRDAAVRERRRQRPLFTTGHRSARHRASQNDVADRCLQCPRAPELSFDRLCDLPPRLAQLRFWFGRIHRGSHFHIRASAPRSRRLSRPHRPDPVAVALSTGAVGARRSEHMDSRVPACRSDHLSRSVELVQRADRRGRLARRSSRVRTGRSRPGPVSTHADCVGDVGSLGCRRSECGRGPAAGRLDTPRALCLSHLQSDTLWGEVVELSGSTGRPSAGWRDCPALVGSNRHRTRTARTAAFSRLERARPRRLRGVGLVAWPDRRSGGANGSGADSRGCVGHAVLARACPSAVAETFRVGTASRRCSVRTPGSASSRS